MKTILMTAFLLSSLSIVSAAENTSAAAQAVNTACAQESATAKCGAAKVGTGLLKCLEAFKKANNTFKFSDSCKASMVQVRTDRKAKKM